MTSDATMPDCTSTDVDGGDDPAAGALTFDWGEIDISAPGFKGPPRDTLTLAFGPQQRLYYLSWKTLPTPFETFGPAPGELPLCGTKHVEMSGGGNGVCDVTVEASTFTSTSFELRIHPVCTNLVLDYVESIQGTRIADGWHVLYANQGSLYGSDFDAHGEGDVHEREPGWVVPTAGLPSVWSAPIALDSGGFAGGPIDHMTVALDGDGKPRKLDFERFAEHLMYGTSMGDWPYSGAGAVTSEYLTATVEEFSADPTHFIIRHRAAGVSDGVSDYVEELSGTRSQDRLMVQYFIKGQYDGADIDAHAAGVLFPTAENAKIAADTRHDGTYDCHGDTLASGGCTFALIAPWTLKFSYTQMTMVMNGQSYDCTGTWTDNEFHCKIRFSPTGRECDGDVTVQAGDDGSLTLWPFAGIDGTVVCQKQ